MKRYHLYALALLLSLLISGCDEGQEQQQTQTGTIILGVEKNETLYTKAGVAVTNEILSVAFVNQNEDTVKYYDNYRESVEGERIILQAGTYNVVVSSAGNEPRWDTPFYYGQEEVTVLNGQTTNATVECRIANTKVSVSFTDAVDDYFSDYEAVVTGKTGTLTYRKGETRSGFYFTEKLSVDLNLVNKNNGLKFQFNKLFQDIQPRYHYILTFDLQPGGGGNNAGGDLDITINPADSTQMLCTILIPEYAGAAEMPKAPQLEIITEINDGGETDGSALTLTKGVDVVNQHKVVITTQAGLRNLYMKPAGSFAGEDDLPPMFDWLKADDNLKDRLYIRGEEESLSDSYVYTLDLAEMAETYLQPNATSSRLYTLSLIALDNYHQEIETVLTYTIKPDLPLMATELSEMETWATFALLRGFCPDGTDIEFRYGLKEEPEEYWQTLPAQSDGKGNLTALATDLEPLTEYAFKVSATLNGEPQESEVIDFTTYGTPTVPNMNFDDWYKDGRHWRLGDGSFWDSGNEGANTLGEVNPTAQETGIIVDGNAAKLSSHFVGLGSLGKFAAGNIYIGEYKETVGMSGAKLVFGREYEGKPTRLIGYYKYTPGTINYAESGAGLSKNDTDQCHIYIALTTKAFDIDTSDKSTLFSPDDKSVIAYGELIAGEEIIGDEANGYQRFEINLEYKNSTIAPTHIVLVASASRYGDYFTGSTSSVLYLDEFELHFDYNPASFSEVEGFE